MRMGARLVAVGMALALPLGAMLVVPPSANAAAYRYWTYWQASAGTWNFATAGPATTLPADGSIEGWRFAVTSAAGTSSDEPRATPSFSTVCDGTPAVSGSKRVALVVDFGDAAAAPGNETPPALLTRCVLAEPDATGYQVLRSVVEVRTNEVGLVCGLAGYPAVGCAELVDQETADARAAAPASGDSPDAPDAAAAEATNKESESESASTALTVILTGLVVALGITAAIVSRRRRAS
jgi:ribosomal protein L12E/L44/L45/RPP1/RPP2